MSNNQVQAIPIIGGADGDSLYCEINGHICKLDRCEICQFHTGIEKQRRRYCVQCSFTKEAPCQHDGCEEVGTFCYLYDHDEERDVFEYYCAEHAQEHGYCYMCGNFWGGTEDFDFSSSGMCSNCRSEYLEDENSDDEGYEEYDGWFDPYDADVAKLEFDRLQEELEKDVEIINEPSEPEIEPCSHKTTCSRSAWWHRRI